MIAVILLCQCCNGFLAAYLLIIGKIIYIVAHLCQHLFFGNTTDAAEFRVHGYILQVVEFAKDAQLRELGYAREEHKLQIWVAVLQW